MSTFTWTGTTGDWTTGTDWKQGSVPGPADSALIAPTGTNTVFVSIGTAENPGIQNVTLNAASTTFQINGTLTASGTVTVSAGLIAVKGNLSAAAITDNALLAYIGTHLLYATPVALGGTLQVQDPNSSTPATLTLGSSEVVFQSGTSATINSSIENGEAIVNQGTIDAAVAGGSMAIVPFNFTNAGLVSVMNEALTIGYDVSGRRGTWTNTGTIALSGTASLTLDGSVATGGIGAITGASGVTLAGTLNNAGATLAVGTGTELGTVSLPHTGVISGGTIADHGNGFTFTGGTLSGVTYQGPLNIATSGGRLVIANSLTVTGAGGSSPGTINLSEGGDAIIDFQNTQTIDNVTITLNGTDSSNPLTEIDVGGNGSALTLGPHATVVSNVANTAADIRGNASDQITVVNQGTIVAAASGGLFSIAPPGGFTNQGTITVSNGEFLSIQPGSGLFSNTKSGSVNVGFGSTLQIEDSSGTPPISNSGSITLASGATLDLAGYFTVPSLGTLVNQGAITQIDGTFDGQGGTLTLGTNPVLNQVLLAGRIQNTTIVPNGDLTVMPSGNASLLNVTYRAPLVIATSNAGLTLDQNVVFTNASGTQPGTLTLSGQNDTLSLQNSISNTVTQTLDNITIVAGNAVSADVIAPAFSGGRFILGSNAAIVSSTAGALVNFAIGGGTSVDIQGTINATGNGGTFTLSGIPSGFSATTLSNDGQIFVGNGDTLNVASAIVAGIDSGTIDVGTGGIACFTTAVASDQTLAFTGATGTLRLRQPSSFGAWIAGFANGHTIDLAGIAADQAVWTAGQLAITNAGNPVAMLTMVGDYSGTYFQAASDNAGGSTIVACYAAGTRIQTRRGEIAVQDLHEGDAVITVSGDTQPIQWIGYRRIDCRRHPAKHRVLPVRVAPHAFGEGQPKRELLLSPDHAVYAEGVLIPIRHLLNGTTVAQIEVDTITYFHIELPRHDVVLAEGMPAESYLDAGARDAFANGGSVMRLHPDFTPSGDYYAMLWDTRGYAPLVVTGKEIERVRLNLAHRATLSGVSRRKTSGKRRAGSGPSRARRAARALAS